MTRRWLKGNTHTHTIYSDGDSAPEIVVDWYAEHGYDFVFLTDHNVVIPESHMERLQGRGPLVWPGEEITMGPIHVNGLGIHETIPLPVKPIATDDSGRPLNPSALLRWSSARVAAQGGVSSVNHPNLYRAVTSHDLRRAGNARLLEIANMDPEAAPTNGGDETQPSTEQIWDRLLSAGQRVWGVASDDAHHFQTWGAEYANPGRGWLMVEAEPNLESCLAALDEGRFYATTGLELADVRACRNEIVIELAGSSAFIELIGPCGRVLSAREGRCARFALPPNMPYARVRATDERGAQLWTQPFYRG